jgi:hypothetical protein
MAISNQQSAISRLDPLAPEFSGNQDRTDASATEDDGPQIAQILRLWLGSAPA